MKKLFIVLIIFLFALNSTVSQTTDNLKKIDIAEIVEKEAAVFLATKGTVGVSLGIIKDDKLYNYNFGTIQKGELKKPTKETLFGIGSISKTFTGLLLAMAVNENKVKLDDDIRKYLDGEYPNLEYSGQPIQLQHLVSHVSRLPFFLSDKAEKVEYSRNDFYNDLHQIKLDTVPGIKFKYSNAGAQLLGFILEKIYHKSYEELVDEKICHPLKMANTKITLTPNDKKHAAKGYNAACEYDPNTYDYFQAAGGIKSTSSDLLKYIQWQMNNNDPSVSLSQKERWGFDMENNKRYSFALGWQIINNNGLRKITQDGNLANCSCVIIFCPELKIGIVVLSNAQVSDAASTLANNISKQLEPRIP